MENFDIVLMDNGVVMISGLSSAHDAFTTASIENKRMYDKNSATLRENHFFERSMERIISSINWASSKGAFDVYVSGKGEGASPFRSWDASLMDMMEDVIKGKIFPILKAKGYKCRLMRENFATKEQYFTLAISW